MSLHFTLEYFKSFLHITLLSSPYPFCALLFLVYLLSNSTILGTLLFFPCFCDLSFISLLFYSSVFGGSCFIDFILLLQPSLTGRTCQKSAFIPLVCVFLLDWAVYLVFAFCPPVPFFPCLLPSFPPVILVFPDPHGFRGHCSFLSSYICHSSHFRKTSPCSGVNACSSCLDHFIFPWELWFKKLAMLSSPPPSLWPEVAWEWGCLPHDSNGSWPTSLRA